MQKQKKMHSEERLHFCMLKPNMQTVKKVGLEETSRGPQN